MPIIEWSKSFDLGIEEFDEHHRRLVDLLNQSYDNFISGASHKVIEDILVELVCYSTYHFAVEEHLMEVHAYPGMPQHCDEHNKFSSRVVELQKAFQIGKTNLSLEVMQFLKNWLKNHILQSDVDFGQFAKGLIL